MSSDMTLEQFATNHYNTFGLKEMASGMRTPFTLTGGYAGATGALQARDLRDPTMGTRFMAKGGEAKKSEGTAKAMLSQLANGGEVTNKYDQYFMDLTADAGKLRTEDEDAFYALTERELGSFKGKYGNELQGAYGNRRLLGTDPETGRNVYVAELVADDLRNWGMSRGQRPSLQRLEIQGPRGYFATSSLPTASDYAAQEKHGFLSAARGNDIIDTGRRVKEYLDEYSRGVQRDIGNVLQSARLNPELAQQVMGFVQSQRPQELVYMPQYQLPEDVQLAEGVNRDLYNKMLLANLSGQQQQKAATRELLAALPEADLADLVYQYGAAPGYLLTQGGRARQPEYTNIEQLQRAAFQRGRQAQTFNPFTGRMENVYQELPYGSFKAFQVDPRTVANPRVTARYQTSYTPVSDLVSQYDMTPEQAFSTGYQEFGQRGLYDLADQLGLDRSYARSFAEQQPEYIEVNPYEERRIGAYTGSVADFVPRNLGLGYAYAQSPIYSELLRRYFDPVKGTLSYYRQNDPRFGTQLFAEGGAVKKFEGVDFSKYKELKDLWYMHPANTAGGLYKGIPSSSEEQAETMRRYTELSDQLSKDLNARGATAGMYDEAMLALGGTDVPSMRKALEEDLVFQKMGGIENFLKRADQ